MNLLGDLKALRDQCTNAIARIDAITAELAAEGVPDGQALIPMRVEGRATSCTLHAVERYRERTGSKRSDETIINRIACTLANAEEMELLPQFRVIELMAHGAKARYFRGGGMIYVVEGGVVMTVHNGEAGRWIKKQDL